MPSHRRRSWLAALAPLSVLTALATSAGATAVGPVTELFGPGDFTLPSTLIDFDDAADGDVANTRYLAQGVEFQNTGAPIPIRDWAGIPRETTSAPNVIATIDRYQDTGSEFSDYLDLFFTAPTWEVGAFFGNDQGLQPTMQMQLSVFDVNDALIGQVLVDVNANTSVDQFAGLRSDATPFHRARFEHVLAQGDLSVVLDDVRFTAVPEPASGALLGAALGVLAAGRRGRQAGRSRLRGPRHPADCRRCTSGPDAGGRGDSVLQRLRALAILIALLAGVPGVASAITIPVSADASVYSSNPDGNYGTSTFEGGLFTGETSGVTRFFLKFQLPVLVPGTYVSSAILTGTYTSDLFDATDAAHGIFLVSVDSWQEIGPTGLTWNNQPVSGVLPLATWDAALAPSPPVAQSFDISAAVNGEYLGDGTLSLMFRALDEGQSQTWEYWSSREHTDQAGFSLDVVISPVPEPGTGALLALGVAALAVRRRLPLTRARPWTRADPCDRRK